MGPNPSRPALLFDGDCGFCRGWVYRWRHVTGEAVEYAASQESAGRFPQVPPAAFARAVQLVETDGAVYEGAEAVYRTLAYAGGAARLWLALYRRLPGFAWASERCYGLVARRRALFSRLTRLLWGDQLSPPTFHLARWFFLRGLALCYLAAFVSFALEARGLVGPHGIAPAGEFLARAREALGAGAWLRVPTLFWWTGASSAALLGTAWSGAAISLFLLAGVAPAASCLALWALYLSLYSAGGIFLGYQWDILLLEAGFLALLAAPWGLFPRLDSERAPSKAALWLLRWLWFRLIFLSGAVKLASGDPAWRSLSALRYHFETQPLPTPLAWYANRLPVWALRGACGLTFVVELLLPFGVFLPRRARFVSFLGVNGLMLVIALTGNYTFFNLLAVALSFTLLDDAMLAGLLRPFRRRLGGTGRRPGELAWRRRLAAAYACFVVPVSLASGLERAWAPAAASGLVRSLAAAGETFSLVNSYGLFAVMTTTRREIVVEGSDDGRSWKPYAFKYKPGDVDRRPGWAEPLQPRLDWQMWFAALSPYQANPWYLSFLRELLKGTPDVTALLAADPFPAKPPKFIRSLFYEYRFAAPGSKAWWDRRLLGLYAPIVTLTPDGRIAAVMPARD